MAYHEGEGKAFTKSPAVLMCPRSRGQRRLILLLATRNWNLLNQATNTQSDSPIGSLSVRYPVWLAWRCLWWTWFEDKWTATTNHPRCALPGVCCDISLLFPSKPPWINFQLSLLQKQTTRGTHENNKQKDFCPNVTPFGHVELGLSVYYQPALCQLATILVPFKIESFALPSTVPC